MSWAFKAILSSLEPSLESPLGAAAGAGSLVGLDEEWIASSLGFKTVYSSPYHAAGSRFFLESILAGLMLLGVEASRIAEDLISLAEAGLARIPDSHIATSSIMPHKRNPVTLEVVRARSSRLLGAAVAGLGIPLKLRLSYNLDLQEANQVLYGAVEDAVLIAEVLRDLAAGLELDPGQGRRLAEAYKPWSSELAEAIALRESIPLRRAYTMVAEAYRGGGVEDLSRRYGVDHGTVAVLRRTGCSRDRIRGVLEARMRILEEDSRRVEGLTPAGGFLRRALEVLDEA